MDARLSLVTLGVSDLERSRGFYRTLGWAESSAGNDDVAFFQAGGVVLALFGRAAMAADAGVADTAPPDGAEAFRGVTLAHNVRTRDEVAAVLAEAVAAGARLLKPAEDVFWGGHAGCFADPDGHIWEVAWNPLFPLDATGTVVLPA